MKFDILSTRRGKLQTKIKAELTKEHPDLEVILSHIDAYSKDSVETIEKLRKVRKNELKRINGALKQTINAHGPITKQFIGSASKRIQGSLLDNTSKPKYNKDKIIGIIKNIIILGLLTWGTIMMLK